MKRILTVLTACVLIVLLLAACGDKGSTGTGDAQGVELKTVLTDINTTYGLTDLKQIETTKEMRRYYQIEEDGIAQFAAERSTTSSDYTAIIMIEAVDADAAAGQVASLEKYLRNQLSDAKSYHPDQVNMMEGCKVKQNGNFVYLVINTRHDEIESTIEEALQ